MDSKTPPNPFESIFGSLKKPPKEEHLTDQQKIGESILNMLKKFKK